MLAGRASLFSQLVQFFCATRLVIPAFSSCFVLLGLGCFQFCNFKVYLTLKAIDFENGYFYSVAQVEDLAVTLSDDTVFIRTNKIMILPQVRDVNKSECLRFNEFYK